MRLIAIQRNSKTTSLYINVEAIDSVYTKINHIIPSRSPYHVLLRSGIVYDIEKDEFLTLVTEFMK